MNNQQLTDVSVVIESLFYEIYLRQQGATESPASHVIAGIARDRKSKSLPLMTLIAPIRKGKNLAGRRAGPEDCKIANTQPRAAVPHMHGEAR